MMLSQGYLLIPARDRLNRVSKITQGVPERSKVIIEVVSTAEMQRSCGDYNGSVETYEKAFEMRKLVKDFLLN